MFLRRFRRKGDFGVRRNWEGSGSCVLTVCIDDVESGTVICKRLIAKRVQAPEVFASESAAVSCFLSAA